MLDKRGLSVLEQDPLLKAPEPRKCWDKNKILGTWSYAR